MKKLFLIGGMGAGKSTARKALTDEGLAWIDLDQVGHEVLMWDTVKDDLRGAFGDDIFDENGEVVRSALAAQPSLTGVQVEGLEGGLVVPSGRVPSPNERQLAVQTARSVTGVTNVVDRLSAP